MTRKKIWDLLEERNLALFPRPCYGRIPNFIGSDKAAEKLRGSKEWKDAKIIVSNPDSAQRSVRKNALKDNKVLIMASPKLKKGYLRISPKEIKGKEDFASTIRGAFKYGKRVDKLPKVDLVITGCVAVDRSGNKLGKGLGLGDKEIARLELGGAINKNTPIATTVHDVQIVDSVPSEPHDKKVNMVITPTRVIRISSSSF